MILFTILHFSLKDSSLSYPQLGILSMLLKEPTVVILPIYVKGI